MYKKSHLFSFMEAYTQNPNNTKEYIPNATKVKYRFMSGIKNAIREYTKPSIYIKDNSKAMPGFKGKLICFKRHCHTSYSRFSYIGNKYSTVVHFCNLSTLRSLGFGYFIFDYGDFRHTNLYVFT